MKPRCGLSINDLLQLLLLNWRIGAAKSILSLTRHDPAAPTLHLTQEPPTPTLPDSKKYAWIMADPDAPSCQNPHNADWIHWVVVNATSPDATDGITVIPYQPPSPPPGSGEHHYITILFEYDEEVSASPDVIHKIQKQIDAEGRGKQKTGGLMRDLIGENAEVVAYHSFIESG